MSIINSLQKKFINLIPNLTFKIKYSILFSMIFYIALTILFLALIGWLLIIMDWTNPKKKKADNKKPGDGSKQGQQSQPSQGGGQQGGGGDQKK